MSTSSTTFTGLIAGKAPLSGPQLVLVRGAEKRPMSLERLPFTIGRRPDKDLVIADPRVSRDHAEIQFVDDDFVIIDLGSKHGTWVNGQKVERQKLNANDRLEFGARDELYAVFNPESESSSNAAREFLSQIASPSGAAGAAERTDLEKLTLFLEAARKLNTVGVLDEIVVTLIETTLRVTGAERGYVFIREDGRLRLAAGRNSKGKLLVEDNTISHSVLNEAMTSAHEFLITDTSAPGDVAQRQSIIANDLRTVICIPLRRSLLGEKPAPQGASESEKVRALLYLDSRFAFRDFSQVSHDILRAIATEAGALLENAHLVQAEEAARRYQQELSIAAAIQQRLMTVVLPDVPFAAVNARNLPCAEIGGDFFDAIRNDQGLNVVICDVCGKGVAAAILASILQGMIYSLLLADMPLAQIATHVNRILVQKEIGSKYATVILARLEAGGVLEYLNCGHVPPMVVNRGRIQRILEKTNLPVGLLADAQYETGSLQLTHGDRLLLVTDGVTEAEDPQGDFFGNERLEAIPIPMSGPVTSSISVSPAGSVFVPVAGADAPTLCDLVFTAVEKHAAGTPRSDDCTVLELHYRG